jgi:hypothetical protein
MNIASPCTMKVKLLPPSLHHQCLHAADDTTHHMGKVSPGFHIAVPLQTRPKVCCGRPVTFFQWPRRCPPEYSHCLPVSGLYREVRSSGGEEQSFPVLQRFGLRAPRLSGRTVCFPEYCDEIRRTPASRRRHSANCAGNESPPHRRKRGHFDELGGVRIRGIQKGGIHTSQIVHLLTGSPALVNPRGPNPIASVVLEIYMYDLINHAGNGFCRAHRVRILNDQCLKLRRDGNWQVAVKSARYIAPINWWLAIHRHG